MKTHDHDNEISLHPSRNTCLLISYNDYNILVKSEICPPVLFKTTYIYIEKINKEIHQE